MISPEVKKSSSSSTPLTNTRQKRNKKVKKVEMDEDEAPLTVRFVKRPSGRKLAESLKRKKQPVVKQCRSARNKKAAAAASVINSCISTIIPSSTGMIRVSQTISTACSTLTSASTAPRVLHITTASSSPAAKVASSSQQSSSSSCCVPSQASLSSSSIIGSSSSSSDSSVSSSPVKNSPVRSRKNSKKQQQPVFPEKRKEHNVSERKRRDLLRGAFLGLKDQVPSLQNSEKRPARIVILHEAVSFVKHLVEKQQQLEKAKEAQVNRKETLLKRLEAHLYPTGCSK